MVSTVDFWGTVDLLLTAERERERAAYFEEISNRREFSLQGNLESGENFFFNVIVAGIM